MPDGQVDAEALARRMLGIADGALRVTYVGHVVRALDPACIAEVLLVARSGAEAKRRAHVLLLQAVTLALADDAWASVRDAVRDALMAAGQDEVARALTTLRPCRTSAPVARSRWANARRWRARTTAN